MPTVEDPKHPIERGVVDLTKFRMQIIMSFLLNEWNCLTEWLGPESSVSRHWMFAQSEPDVRTMTLPKQGSNNQD